MATNETRRLKVRRLVQEFKIQKLEKEREPQYQNRLVHLEDRLRQQRVHQLLTPQPEAQVEPAQTLVQETLEAIACSAACRDEETRKCHKQLQHKLAVAQTQLLMLQRTVFRLQRILNNHMRASASTVTKYTIANTSD